MLVLLVAYVALLVLNLTGWSQICSSVHLCTASIYYKQSLTLTPPTAGHGVLTPRAGLTALEVSVSVRVAWCLTCSNTAVFLWWAGLSYNSFSIPYSVRATWVRVQIEGVMTWEELCRTLWVSQHSFFQWCLPFTKITECTHWLSPI